MISEYDYAPQTASSPGETLKETLEALGIPQADLARRTGLSTKHINQIVQGSAAISPETALLLERVLGVPAHVWNALDAAWQTHIVREQERETLMDQVGWLSQFPLAELVARGILPDRKKTVDNLQRLLDFFGVATPELAEEVWRGYRTAFRRSTITQPNEFATAVWLRETVLTARDLPCEPFQRDLLQELLPQIRRLSRRDPRLWLRELPALCSGVGIAVVFSPAFKNTHLSGATRWLHPDKAMIALTDRYKKDDRFWFTVFHEIGHVLLHGKRLTFLDGDTLGGENTAEQEANTFAADTLIPLGDRGDNDYLSNSAQSWDTICTFAESAGVSPGIIVGRLQHDGILGWNEGNHLKQAVDFAKLGPVQQ